MIANYTTHAANERTFLAWIRTGLAVAAFGILLAKMNALVGKSDSLCASHGSVDGSPALVAAIGHWFGLALLVVGIAIIARGGVSFERMRSEIDGEEVKKLPRTCLETGLSAVLAIGVGILGVYIAVR
ncbi:DUF202 domain-containing protein [Starkeya sp. ORNL1]|uniref:YidH family protein n=1 Tax=Starkeya sp. ORNL1 TaxID=2709380 RepID=UPI0014649625|nr:DUF202 domain-containing protein [Starkeya sp. ORNL1]QJP16823.1 DUF202 domain-containing protein [Starkeya sp. ORNL1]